MSFDDGTPADTIYTNIVVFVDTTNFEPEIMGDTIICDGDTTTLMLDEPYDAYQWSGGSTNPELKTTGGTYVVTVTKGFCSKKDTHTVDIQILPQPTITGDTEFCEGGSTTLSIADTFDVFTWSTGDLTEDIVVDDSITVKVVVEKWNCENVDSVSLIINPLPEATIVGDTFYCLGSNTVLSVQNFAAYEWNNGNNTRSISATEGDYYCLVTDAKGCQAYSDTVQVTEIDPNEQIFGDTTICIRTGNLNTLNGADGNAVYAWSTGDSTQEITVGVGEYQLVVVDSMGCFDSSSVEVIYITTPVTDFSIDPDSFTVRKLDVQFTDLTMLDSGFIETYYWTFDELGNEGTSDRQNPVYAYQNEGLVEVTLTTTADNGCKASQSKPYLILREIPTSNVITPNGDGVNDVLYFKRLEYFPNSELTIYNRWGSVVYSTSDYRNDWDGDNLNEGVYYYVLKVSKIDQVHKGSVTILK
jgi:gliding motility-associated-like protein